MSDEKKVYPFISPKNWFALRNKVIKSIPSQVSISYVASVLNMSDDSARANVFSGIKLIGLIESDGKPTERLMRWRSDDQYSEACKEIWLDVYPDELRAIAPDVSTPKETIERWFSKQGAGESSATKSATFYLLLLRADLSEESGSASVGKSLPKNRAGKTAPTRAGNKTKENVVESTAPVYSAVPTSTYDEDVVPVKRKHHPSLHIDIQIHISPEVTAEQIDQIFASMAKHLKEM